MIALSCTDITKLYGIDVILEGISFTVQKGDKIGIIGKNGVGKSTLFKILAGKIPYDKGSIYMAKDSTIGYLEQSVDFRSATTVYDECLKIFEHVIEMEKELRNLETDISKIEDTSTSESIKIFDNYSKLMDEFTNINGYGYKSEIKGVLKGLGFEDDDLHKPIAKLSGGQRSRMNIAKLLLQKPDILLLDEPTNHLDIEAISWLESFIRSYDGTIFVISHDRYFLDQITTKIIEIENKSIIQFNGSYTKFVEYKESIYIQQLRKYEKQQEEIAKQEEIIRRFKQHGTEKLAKRARSREKRLDSTEVIERPMLVTNRTKLNFEPRITSGKEVLKVENLKKAYEDTTIFKDVSFDIYKGEKVALIGPNGIGKTTLFKILLDLIPYNEGDYILGHNVIPGYYDQEQENLDDSNTLINEICEQDISINEAKARNLLAAFLFYGEEVFKDISTLSGGEKSRLSLLKLMLSESNFLLLDEPTNHLDLEAKEVLESALNNYSGTIFTISHDRYFLNKVATKIIEISKYGVTTYLGNYDYYVEKKNALDNEDDDVIENVPTKTQLKEMRKKEKNKKLEAKKLKQTIAKLEEDIHTIEERIEEIEALLCDPEIYSSPAKSKEINDEYAQKKIALDNLYLEWEGLQ